MTCVRGSAIAVFIFAVAAWANPVQFDTYSYNFARDGGGGGIAGWLNSSQDGGAFYGGFTDNIDPAHTRYSAYLSTLTDDSGPGFTGFGSNSSLPTVEINGGDSDSAFAPPAGWFGNQNSVKSSLSDFVTGSDSSTTANGAGQTWADGAPGQVNGICATPEPRALVWALLVLFFIYAFWRQPGQMIHRDRRARS